MQQGLIAKESLSDTELPAVRELAAVCEAHDGHGVKLNWRMMAGRQSGQVSDFCWYESGQLAGYAPLDRFGPSGEVTALVHPDFRRRGIGRAVTAAAHRAAQPSGCTELLLVNVRTSATGRAFAAALGHPLDFSEYHLEWAAIVPPSVPDSLLQFRQATLSDLPFLIRIAALSFDILEDEARRLGEGELRGGGARAYLAERDGRPIGRLSALIEDEGVYLRSFGVLPEERGRGVGRALLAATIAQLWNEGWREFALDVVTNNSNALSLYRSVGFREVLAYNYYRWPLW